MSLFTRNTEIRQRVAEALTPLEQARKVKRIVASNRFIWNESDLPYIAIGFAGGDIDSPDMSAQRKLAEAALEITLVIKAGVDDDTQLDGIAESIDTRIAEARLLGGHLRRAAELVNFEYLSDPERSRAGLRLTYNLNYQN